MLSDDIREILLHNKKILLCDTLNRGPVSPNNAPINHQKITQTGGGLAFV